ncbi:hypothetical protein LOZ80_23200 [Paenibacillus sp. HWE-109]|uniref:phosphotriesterase family protein n=1 Tax=Paenibacillus sp. HWE-109 TaxID=1306526 RepID=UPI001EE0A324|nr:hypothetical protein [Paenibacillus sp. HWE-109]UKS24519.1 hypothetical protein LOZ80_23200 [Paenibacillus sp. HWE-109]
MTATGIIRTVLGDIPNEQLGFCHSHEHLFIAEGTPSRLNPVLQIDDFGQTKDELMVFKSLGGEAIVDAQPIGCGRMADMLTEVSKQTGIHIIASTGFHKRSFYSDNHWLFRGDAERLANTFIAEIEDGMYVHADNQDPRFQITAKAGLIKTAIEEDSPGSTCINLLNAAAMASLATGIPVMCHTETHRQGMVVAEHLMKRGVVPKNLIICHLDRTLGDYSVHQQLAQIGVYLEYDTIGRFKYHSDEEEADLIVQMLEWGYGESLLLGLDTTRARLKSYGGEIGLDHMKINFIPLLRQRGVSESAIADLMIHNPAHAFKRKK